MNCSDMSILIQLQDSGEITAGQRQQLASHLNECEACRQLRADLAVLRRTLSASPIAQSGPSQDVLVAIRKAAAEHRFKSRWQMSHPWRAALSAAAGLVICLTGLRFLNAPPSLSGLKGAGSGVATEILPLSAIVMGNEADLDSCSGDTELEVLADQLLILQGMKVDSRDDLMDESSQPEDSQPTALQWNSIPEPRSGICV